MQARKLLIGSGLVLSILSAAGLFASLPAGAQTPTKPATTAPSKSDDGAAEFAKLDANHDGFIDKKEAILEPRLLARFGDADKNKDGKIDKSEFLQFEKEKNNKKQ